MLWGPRIRITYFLSGGLLSCDGSDHYTTFYNICPLGSFWTFRGHIWKYTGTAHGNQCPTFFAILQHGTHNISESQTQGGHRHLIKSLCMSPGKQVCPHSCSLVETQGCVITKLYAPHKCLGSCVSMELRGRETKSVR